jgi:uncharacterized MnhB-related membrane protein
MILLLAWRVVFTTDLFRAALTFFAFGLLVSLAWVRLQAVDVALAEAAIGAGLTGALFLAALSRLRRSRTRGNGSARAERDSVEGESEKC